MTPSHNFFFKLFKFQLTYSEMLISGVEFSDSTLTTRSAHQHPSLIPITYLTHPPPTSPLVTISFPIVKSLFLGFPLSILHRPCTFVFLNSTRGGNHMVFVFL